MRINFAKMHSLGNDFVVIDGITQKFNVIKNQVIKIADRHLGIGCDQILLIEPPNDPNVDLSFRIFNSDGSEANQCGNGARCITKFAIDNGLVASNNIIVQNNSGLITCEKINEYVYTVCLPNLPTVFEKVTWLELQEIKSAYLSNIGNNHLICQLNNNKNNNPYKLYKRISSICHEKSIKANITFIEVIDKTNVKANVFEYGAGQTLACGSSACATVATTHYLELTDAKCRVKFKLGYVDVELLQQANQVKLTGPAITSFVGEFKI